MNNRIKEAVLVLLLAGLLILTGCEAIPGLPSGTPQSGSSVSAETAVEGLKAIVEVCLEKGSFFSGLLMDETAAYFYGFAGASVSALRLAVERILWLKGEGDDFASLAADSRYTDWDEIAEICYASPYPYYFEGLIHELRGEDEEAIDDYLAASVLANYPETGLNFLALRDQSVPELYALRDELRALEDRIYEQYSPDLFGYERNPCNGFPEYLLADAYEKLEAEQYDQAMIAARYCVRFNPRVEEHWTCAVTAALYADQGYQAALWLEEGLKYFPEGEGLNHLLSSLQDVLKGGGAS